MARDSPVSPPAEWPAVITIPIGATIGAIGATLRIRALLRAWSQLRTPGLQCLDE